MCSSVFPSLKPSFMVFRFEFYDPQNYLHIFFTMKSNITPIYKTSLGHSMLAHWAQSRLVGGGADGGHSWSSGVGSHHGWSVSWQPLLMPEL